MHYFLTIALFPLVLSITIWVISVRNGLICARTNSTFELIKYGCAASLFDILTTTQKTDILCPLFEAACQAKNPEIINVLFSKASNFNIRLCEKKSTSPLHECALFGCFKCCRILLQHNADPLYVLSDGRTALQMVPVTRDGKKTARIIMKAEQELREKDD